MPIADDGDLIRGLGFVALYAAYLEEALDEVVDVLNRADPAANPRILRRSTGQKIEYIRERIRTLEPLPAELENFPDLLIYLTELFEERHMIIHGRIYAVPGVGDVRRPARLDHPEYPATSAELYDLANRIFDARAPLNQASLFALPRRIQMMLQAAERG